MQADPNHSPSGQSLYSRKEFLRRCTSVALGCGAASALGPLALAAPAGNTFKEAMFYRRHPGLRTECMLCPNGCVRENGEVGQCRARRNIGGTYYSLVYGLPCVIELDETGKCPLNHFQIPGKAFSIATAGCNLSCLYCQNWEFSQSGPSEVPKVFPMSPRQVVDKATENKAAAVAFFYTEPTVYYEYMLDVAKVARERSLKTIMVTAGYIRPEPLEKVLPLIDAVTVGLKGWNEKFYEEYVGGDVSHVKQTIRILTKTEHVWWEVVNLIVPSLNDKMEEIAAMASWLRETAGAERPLHFTRFRPMYRLKRLPATPTATLTKARQTALEQGLKHVYVGNAPGHEGANTFCPSCGKTIVERISFTVLRQNIKDGNCGFCGKRVRGVWL